MAAPRAISDEAVRLAVIGKLAWIRRQQSSFAKQPRESARQMVSGESHYVFGLRLRLRVIEHPGRGRVVVRSRNLLELYVRTGSNRDAREKLLVRWYRERLRDLVPPILARWEKKLGVRVSHWGIRRMRTKWGTSNADAKRIWLNLELAKKPVQCLEYLVLHELVHLRERHHNERFATLMDHHMPDWRTRRKLLASQPLGSAAWSY